MGRPLRFGVLGTADIARRRLGPALAAGPMTSVTAVASRTAARAEEFSRLFGGRAVHGYADLLDRDDVDAVYIPLPTALHAEWIERALRAGKHVLAEKPLTTHAEATRDLFELAARLGLVLRENVMTARHPQHAAVRALVEAGTIGRPLMLTASFTVPARPPGDIRLSPQLGGGALLDTGVYPVRAALHLFDGEPDVLGAALESAPWGRVDTSGAALLRTPAGVLAQLAFGIENPYRSAYELSGTEGRLRLDHAFTPPARHVPLLVVEHAGHTEQRSLEPCDQVAASVAEFATAVAGGDTPHAAADSLRQARLLDAIRRVAAGRAGLHIPSSHGCERESAKATTVALHETEDDGND